MQAIKIEKATKKFDNSVIFSDLDLEINEGELVVIVGKSGEGKSTLLRTVCGLEKIDSGSISIFGSQIVKDGKYSSDADFMKAIHKVGMVFQSYNLFENMTVKQNICQAAINQKIGTSKEIQEKYEFLTQEFDIQGNENKYPTKISGGQSQRVAIARALMLNPKVILFDEPTSALDRENTQNFIGYIKKLQSQNYTIVIVTHDMDLVSNLDARVLEMKNKQIVNVN